METWLIEAIRLHVEKGVSVNKITKLVGKSHTTITKYFKIHNIEFKNNNEKTSGEYLKALDLYKTGEFSVTELSNKFKIDRHALSRRIKAIGLNVVNKQNLIRFNENIFDDIDTEEKAYWLGFLYADGCVSSINNTIEISLKYSDFNHLYKFKNFLNCTNNIIIDTIRCRLMFSSGYFKKRLIELGCTPRKSLTLEFPTEGQMPDHLIIPFIRGYFDGDGTFTYFSRNGKGTVFTPKIGFIGTQDFLKGVQDVLLTDANLHLANKNGSNKCFEISFGSKKSTEILKKLYKDANIYLDRKFKRYTIFKNNNFAVQSSNILDYEKAISEETKEYLIKQYKLNFNVNTEINNDSKKSLSS